MVDISPDALKAISRLVDEGRYGSVTQFLGVAVQNQLVVEQAAGSVGHSSKSSLVESAPSGPSPLAAEFADPVEILPGSVQSGPLFGQYYRFLPLKFVLRLLAAQSTSRLPLLDAFAQQASTDAFKFAEQIRDNDSEEQPFSLLTGFPGSGRDPLRSQQRFAMQYVGRVRADGSLDGLGGAMGFVGAKLMKNEWHISLTEPGVRFARISNPLLDSKSTEALSDEEVHFLLQWLRREMPDEHEQVVEVLKNVAAGRGTPGELGDAMAVYYRRRYPDDNWTPAKANLMRSGCVSRLIEMHLLDAKKEGSRVFYSVSSTGSRMIESV